MCWGDLLGIFQSRHVLLGALLPECLGCFSLKFHLVNISHVTLGCTIQGTPNQVVTVAPSSYIQIKTIARPQ